jgi:iron complex outermembrane receptor protein
LRSKPGKCSTGLSADQRKYSGDTGSGHHEKYQQFSKKESGFVARLPLKNLENPQVYNVTKELFQEQVAVDLGSISKNVPGAGVPMIANQGRVTFRSRGFETEPNARNGVAGAAFS